MNLPLSALLILCGIRPIAAAAAKNDQTAAREEARLAAFKLDQAARRMKAGEAAVLEQDLRKTPDDLKARSQLLSYYWWQKETSKRRLVHLRWLIAHHPDAPILFLPSATVCRSPLGASADEIAGLKNAWLAAAKRRREAVVFGNAAFFLTTCEGEDPVVFNLLSAASKLEPENPEWWRLLGEQAGRESFHAKSEPERVEKARRGVPYHRRAYELTPKDENYIFLKDLMALAYDSGEHETARNYAEEALRRGTEKSAKAFIRPATEHEAQTILGLLSLRQNDRAGAKARLSASCETLPKEKHARFAPNPNPELAAALLQLGELDAASVFLDRLVFFDEPWRWRYWPASTAYTIAEAYGDRAYQDRSAYLHSYRWHEYAARLGHPGAQTRLGLFLSNGIEGVAQKDSVEALKWFILAARGGQPEAQSELKDLLPRMTKEQVLEAQRRADAAR